MMQLCRPSSDGSGGVASSVGRVHGICRTTAVCGRRVAWAATRPIARHNHYHHPEQRPLEEGNHPRDDGESMEPFFASLSAAISAVEAAHFQFRLAHASRDPDAVRSAARVVFSQLTHINLLERSYRRGAAGSGARRRARLEAQVREQRDRLKTVHLDAKRFQYELRDKDEEVAGLRAALTEVESRNAALEGELRLPDLDAAYFLSALRYALTAVRRFVELMARHMVQSRWDLDAAAGTLQPDVLRAVVRPEHRTLAFVSFVCRAMFTGFHRADFGVPRPPAPPDRCRAFEEFLALKAATARDVLGGAAGEEEGRLFGEFCRVRYLGLVEAKMESSFFGKVDQREMVASGGGFPETEFFECFAEVARRVWLLHRLAEAFGDKGRRPAIFQVKRGRGFSEAYMEEVGGDDAEEEEERGGGRRRGAVGFMVVPGFRVGKVVIRSKVFLARTVAVDGRP